MSDHASQDDSNAEGKPRGKSLRWTQADIDNLAKVGPEDVTSANAAFRRFAPKKFKTLLSAKKAPRQS